MMGRRPPRRAQRRGGGGRLALKKDEALPVAQRLTRGLGGPQWFVVAATAERETGRIVRRSCAGPSRLHVRGLAHRATFLPIRSSNVGLGAVVRWARSGRPDHTAQTIACRPGRIWKPTGPSPVSRRNASIQHFSSPLGGPIIAITPIHTLAAKPVIAITRRLQRGMNHSNSA